MIKVSMLEFLRIGEFGPIRLGMDRDQVYSILGEPEYWGLVLNKVGPLKNARYCFYGSFTFHFPADQLWAISSDRFTKLAGGAAIEIDPWLLKAGAPRAEIAIALAEQRIDFMEAVVSFNDSIYLVCKSGARITFEERRDMPRNGLYAISRSATTNGQTTPLSYKLIGHIEHFYDRINVAGVQLLPEATLRQGQRVSLRMPEQAEVALDPNDGFSFMQNFREQIVEELYADEQPVEQANGGQLVTFKTALNRNEGRRGVSVYLAQG